MSTLLGMVPRLGFFFAAETSIVCAVSAKTALASRPAALNEAARPESVRLNLDGREILELSDGWMVGMLRKEISEPVAGGTAATTYCLRRYQHRRFLPPLSP